ncbi:uncharacterized protein PAC_04372 [Phialocephala subalpina]|uniref:Uncharacterized protein n=1 Tax=Phialocephala subalpina TaxID=576137 RepID=A0A1L7WNY8_9HELO|nr:uncharacterized protein PAC_04372 [Phialocephala subalpina]
MSCTINTFFWHACGHTNSYTDHQKMGTRSDPLPCPTLTPWTTPLLAPLLNTVSPIKCRSSKTVYTYIHRKCCACESAIRLPNAPPKYLLDELVHRRTKYRALWNAQQYSEESHRQAHPFENLRDQELLEAYKVKLNGGFEAELTQARFDYRTEKWLQESEFSPLEQDKITDGELDEFEDMFALPSG